MPIKETRKIRERPFNHILTREAANEISSAS
jgi:hypothetical protein